MSERTELTSQTWRDLSHAAQQQEPIAVQGKADPDETKAGEAVHLRLEYTPQGFDLPDGTELAIAPPRFWRKHLGMAFTELHSQFDTTTERDPGGSFALVKAYPPECSDLQADCELLSGGFYYLFHVTLRGTLKDGETLVVYLGDPVGPKAQVPKTAADHPLPTFVRVPDEEHFREVSHQPVVTARGDIAEKLRVRCPAVVPEDTNMQVSVVAVDGVSENPASAYDAEIRLSCADGNTREPVTVHHTTEKRRSTAVITTSGKQFDYIRAYDEQNSLAARSNPVGRPDDFNDMNVYFGDIHVHAEPGDGFETAEEAYEYARWYSGLDFCAVTHQQNSYASRITQDVWEVHLDLNDRYHEDGTFVTLPGCETYCDGGHRISYFRSTEQATRFRVSRARGPEYDLGDPDERGYPDPSRLWEALQDFEAFTCLHHTRYIWSPDWDRPLDEMERCIEIWSRWGTNEVGGPHSAQVALQMGHRLGFMASTDNQFAQPGNGPFGVNDGAACAGVFAPELSREAIYDAIKSRHCYGTTGEKMLVNFSLHGEPMGSLLEDYAGDRDFRCVAAGTEQIETLEIVRNNEVIATIEPGELTCSATITDQEPLDDLLLEPSYEMKDPFAFYYLRVTQKDGHQAWTSPIWITG